MLRLNSIPESVFSAKDSIEQTLKVNNANGTTRTLNRREIVSMGRLLVSEYMGKEWNKRPNETDKYTSRLNGFDYSSVAKKFTEKKLLFCAQLVASQLGIAAPSTFEDFKRDVSSYMNSQFLAVNAMIDRDVLNPLLFSVISDMGRGLAQIDFIPFGSTKEITIRSNDAFLWEDSAPGSEKSTSRNWLYDKTITLNPKTYVCNASIKFFQDLVNGDPGYYYRAIIYGLYSKMYAVEIAALKGTIGDITASGYTNPLIPSGLIAPTYTTPNWIDITDKVAAANGVDVTDLMAIGSRRALNQIVPMDGTGGAILGFQYGLGEQWFKNGYLANVGGVDLFPITPVIVPGTQNSSLLTIDPGNDIFILARAGYRPIMGAVYEGDPLNINAQPAPRNEALGTADMTIDINMSTHFDYKAVFASKVGVIRSVYPTTAGA